jgi:hypothetical protein
MDEFPAELPSRHKLIAMYRLQQMSITNIAKKVGARPETIHKVMATDEYKQEYRDLVNNAVAEAANDWKAEVSSLRDAALKALKNKLEANDINAIRIVMTTLGLDKQEVSSPQPALTVVLPDYQGSKKSKEVDYVSVTDTKDREPTFE